MTTALLDTYTEPLCFDVALADRVAALFELSLGQDTLEYQVQAFEVDAAGAVLQDVSAYLINDGDDSDAVSYDCTAPVPADVQFTISSEVDLTWGSSVVAVYQLIRSVQYNLGNGHPTDTYLRFPLGQFVVTSPGFDDMDANEARVVTGYGKNYLLQNSPSDALSFFAGSTYSAAVRTVFTAAGILTEGEVLSTVCDYPATWHAKIMPTPHSYPMTDSTYLDVVNDLLDASGCIPIYVPVTGRWRIQRTPKPTRQTLRWRWAASEDDTLTEDDLDHKIVMYRRSRYSGDTWNAPNQWNFVQSGLDFPPGFDGATDGSSGLYQVNNTTIPPTDQVSVGRVVAVTISIDVSGADDLVIQGDKAVTEALSQAEKIELATMPWPAAGHYDVFQLTHEALPASSVRRVQAQSWKLPLWGQPMEWQVNAVAEL